jgi:predicted nucleic acid-binding protein
VQLELQESPAHRSAHDLLRREVLEARVPLALTPLVLAEFIHVVSDPRRFQRPLTMEQAISKAGFWWDAAEVQHIFPTADSTTIFLAWMKRHQLGRKRILDTQLAATLHAASIRRLFTSNPADFQVFACFELLSP